MKIMLLISAAAMFIGTMSSRNALGEPVASGVYFYTLTTRNFAQTRQ